MNIKYWIIPALAVASLASGCNTTPVQEGAVLGGALGAGIGAIAGHQSGNQSQGAVIGAGVGALSGAIIGDAVGDPPPRRGVVYQQAPPPPAAVPSAPARYAPVPARRGHYEVHLVTTPSGEKYEPTVWVPE